ncbi:Lrp/AsnC family transcriptional regulator [Dysgonomonas capnocytophagoides]|uniref:Lrp/AsnC family transcriptional regulator n=2 Tax=Dysgonomonas capnocytophagoides TaxID=45254 RepID=A0A4Y8LA79_9BACT|nr:Lrp/AsnC family transcriptional regulator [Dysgonomonas capnocytophagoides]TFD99054.1 Lrp/AsnC family transcriptional regulator [Dysgonomonas capnocytophagoides]
MEKLDATDIKILGVLQKDSKLTTKEIAKLVNLSPTPVFERQKRLEREGYIKRYTAELDPEKLGCNLIVFCSIKLKQHTKENGFQFMEAINQIDTITNCYNISGDYDFMLKIYVQDMKHYQDFVLNTLGEIDAIGSLHSTFVIGEVKNTRSIPIY